MCLIDDRRWPPRPTSGITCTQTIFDQEISEDLIMTTIIRNRLSAVGRLLARRAEASRQRRDMKLLGVMPDHLLRDIGLHRGDVAFTRRGPT
jgi:uncharacterized protein YjiS (DUF1127 family)